MKKTKTVTSSDNLCNFLPRGHRYYSLSIFWDHPWFCNYSGFRLFSRGVFIYLVIVLINIALLLLIILLCISSYKSSHVSLNSLAEGSPLKYYVQYLFLFFSGIRKSVLTLELQGLCSDPANLCDLPGLQYPHL